MALNDTPQSGQTLASSQPLIRSNFVTFIDSAFGVNHVPYQDSNQGKHNFLTLPSNHSAGGYPLLATVAGDTGLYGAIGATSTVPELFFQRQSLSAGQGYAFTEGANASPGWSRLPSGLLMKWGTFTCNGTNTQYTVPYNGIGPNFTLAGTTVLPFPPQISCYNAGATPSARISDFDRIMWFAGFNSLPATSFVVVNNNSNATTSFFWLLLGPGT